MPKTLLHLQLLPLAAGEGAKPKVDPDVKPKHKGGLPGCVLDLNDLEWVYMERAESTLSVLDEANCELLIDYLRNFFAQSTDAIAEA